MVSWTTGTGAQLNGNGIDIKAGNFGAYKIILYLKILHAEISKWLRGEDKGTYTTRAGKHQTLAI